MRPELMQVRYIIEQHEEMKKAIHDLDRGIKEITGKSPSVDGLTDISKDQRVSVKILLNEWVNCSERLRVFQDQTVKIV